MTQTRSNIYKLKNLSKYKNVIHGISTREFGSMKNEDNTINRENLGKFLDFLNLSQAPVCMEQVHGGNVSVVTKSGKLLIENTDGIVTNRKNIPLGVVTADCLPILFFDPKNKVIGVAHGGRKGLTAGIVKNMTEKFEKNFSSNPSDIEVGIGPGIEKNCYEVDGQVLDIRKLANDLLLKEGIMDKNIENLDICTKCNRDELYSYRGGDNYKRFVSVITII